MTRPRTPIALLLLLFLVVGCGVPRAGSTGATSTGSPGTSASDTATDASTDISPITSPSSADAASTTGQWPPTLLLTDLKEAGLVTVTVAGIRFQLPAGSAAVGDQDPARVEYRLTSPTTTDVGRVLVQAADAARDGAVAEDAAALVAADSVVAVTRTGVVDIPGSASAAIGDAGSGAEQVWLLGMVTTSGVYVRAEFRAPVAAFDDLLLYQSLCSVKVTG